MYLFRFRVFSLVSIIIIIGLIISGCSSDDNPTKPSQLVWTSLGTGISDDVYSLTVYDNKLIAGGWFTTAGGVSVSHIAAWDGSSWTSLGSGVNDWIEALTVYDNKLIAGG